MANVWMHNGFLQVEGEKMSKSLGNFVTINELLHTSNFGGRKWAGETLRLAMLRTHYRQPIDWTLKSLEESWRTLESFFNNAGAALAGQAKIGASVLDALMDDLNTPKAIAELHALDKPGRQNELGETLKALGFTLEGRLREEWETHLGVRDTFLWGLLASDWTAR
jgi:cysteinyl-tRNA synthetase